MKTNKFILALIALLTCSVQVLAETKTGNCGNDATYEFDTETGNLTISGTGAIDNSAFVIGKYDFCSNIKNVVIENGITEIGESAFHNCTKIVSITLPDGITSIANYAFSGTSITSINIPKSVTNIGKTYAINCPNLASITVDESNTIYDSRDNCNAIVETATNLLVYGCKSTIIPNGVEEINKYAFANCGELTFINIPNSVTKINQGAFSRCSNLKSINISNKLTFIDGWAFDNCSSLDSINIPSSVESINIYAFLSCSSLTSVVVEWDEPLVIAPEVFNDVTLSKVTLYVPEGKVNDYKNADVWKNFGKIVDVVKVTFSVNDEEFGSVEGESGNIIKGTTIDIKAVANEGYHFVKWSNGSVKATDTITVVSDTALVAEFATHQYGEWDTTLVATCAVAGLRARACACGEVETDTIAKLAHTVVVDSAKTATCTATGLTEGKHCSVCDSVFVAQQTVAKLAHTVVVDSAKTATCTIAGLTEGKHCSVCDSILVKQNTIPAGHKIVIDSAKTATCTATGLTEGKHCSVCDSILVKQETIPAGHKIVVDSAKTATCTIAGLTEGKHCSVCDSIFVAQQTLPALGHKVETVAGVSPTCTIAGLTEGKHCSVCDSILVAQQTVAKLAHTIVVDSAKTATCTATGLTEGKHCSVCDSILVAQQTIAKLAHTIVVDSAKTATCTVAGLTEGKHCSVCNEVIKAQDTIPALGHSFTNYIYNNDATYEADGTEKAECDREGCNAIDVRTAEGTKLQTSVGTELAEGVVIYAHHSTIVVENAVEDIFIYNADGRMIARETVTANRMEMPMTEQGVYIVRTGDTTQRVFVSQN